MDQASGVWYLRNPFSGSTTSSYYGNTWTTGNADNDFFYGDPGDQIITGGEEFNNLLHTTRHERMFRVEFTKHAESMGAISEKVTTINEFKGAFERAKAADPSYVIAIEVAQYDWTESGAWSEVGIPEVSDREQVRAARAELDAEKKLQRSGV